MLRIPSTLKNFEISATDGYFGTVSDFLFDDSSFKVRWMVVDTGTWLPGRRVLLHPSAIGGIDASRRNLTVGLTKAKIKDSPDILSDQPVSRQMENNLYDYYGWDPVWGHSYFGPDMSASALGPVAYSAHAQTDRAARFEAHLADENPHLRSMEAVTGYHIQASDGAIGHVENFLIDDLGWDVRYLIVDTSNWWFGQHVLISPFAVRAVDWSHNQVHVSVTKAQVRDSPPWAKPSAVDGAYEQRLHMYYGWPGYGW